jgi:hypothetical protein
VLHGWAGFWTNLKIQHKPTVERQIYIDIRCMKRQTGLIPGTVGTLSWSSHGNNIGAVNFEITENCLILKYRLRESGGAWEDVEQVIFFDQTPCNYGGHRKWFLCSQCERRVEILYGLFGSNKYFLCRDCHGLTYPSCNTHPRKRLFTKADKLKQKIGVEPGIMDFIPEKPKGMHRSTFYGIVREIQKLEYLGDQAMFKKWEKDWQYMIAKS